MMFFIIDSKERRAEAAHYVASITATPLMCVEVKPYKRDRSKAQNRLYWMWLNAIGPHTGYTAEELHEVCKVRFLGVCEKQVDGITLIEPVSTTSLDVQGFTQYLERVEVLGRSLGVQLPIPDDYAHAMNNKESSECGNF